MDAIRIILATLISTVPSLLAFGLIVWLQKRREADAEYSLNLERARADRWAGLIGAFPLRCIQAIAGFCAIGPCLMLALAILDPAVPTPSGRDIAGGP